MQEQSRVDVAQLLTQADALMAQVRKQGCVQSNRCRVSRTRASAMLMLSWHRWGAWLDELLQCTAGAGLKPC